MASPACPLCQQPIRVPVQQPIRVPVQTTEVQAFARHFAGECRGRAKRPQ